NAALRTQRAFTAACSEYLRSGDAAAVSALVAAPASDFLLEDRRSIVAMPNQERHGLGSIYATMRAQGYVQVSDVAVAVRGDRVYYLAASRTRTDVGTDGTIVNRTVEVVGSALLTFQDEETRTPEGNDYERTAYLVLTVTPSGRIRAAEWFDEARYDDARAR